MAKREPKQFQISFTRRIYPNLPNVLAELEELTGDPKSAPITYEALEEKLARERAKKKREERDGKER